MTSNSSLYGLPRPKTTKSKEISSSTTLAFTSQLSSLLSQPSTAPTSGRTRPSKSSKSSIFTAHNKNTKKRALADISDGPSPEQQHQTSLDSVDPATLHRSKRKMEEKARLYASMKRGEYVPPSGATNKEEHALVDFDRKWAEAEEAGGRVDTSSSDSEDDDPAANELVDYEDEFGRQRRATKAEVERLQRRRNAQSHALAELQQFSARPAAPSTLIYGDTVQTSAFNPDETITSQMETIAKKRDRSMTPPEEVHYDASKEVRSKGVGFYNFSRDKEGRQREMEALEKEREETERGRKEREERVEKRKKEIEERRRIIGEKRGKKLADAFLDGLGDV
jgi:hypothetical protein